MALADIRQFLFYIKYLWGPTDFQNMQLWLQSEYRGLAEGGFGGSILSGLLCTPAGGMVVNVADGLACAPDGRLIVFAAASATVATPAGNPALSLIILRPKLTDANNIPEPANPANTVPLHQQFQYDLLVLNGTPAATPAYPATQANDVILMGISLTSGQSSIAATDFERSLISVPSKKIKSIQQIIANKTILVTDNHIDIDATAGVVTATLPSAASCPGQDFTFIKIDSSANKGSIASTDLISGQSSWDLDDQWQTMTIRSVGTTYRVV